MSTAGSSNLFSAAATGQQFPKHRNKLSNLVRCIVDETYAKYVGRGSTSERWRRLLSLRYEVMMNPLRSCYELRVYLLEKEAPYIIPLPLEQLRTPVETSYNAETLQFIEDSATQLTTLLKLTEAEWLKVHPKAL